MSNEKDITNVKHMEE